MPRKIIGVIVILLLLAGIWWVIKNLGSVIALAGNPIVVLPVLIIVLYLLYRLLKWCFSRNLNT